MAKWTPLEDTLSEIEAIYTNRLTYLLSDPGPKDDYYDVAWRFVSDLMTEILREA